MFGEHDSKTEKTLDRAFAEKFPETVILLFSMHGQEENGVVKPGKKEWHLKKLLPKIFDEARLGASRPPGAAGAGAGDQKGPTRKCFLKLWRREYADSNPTILSKRRIFILVSSNARGVVGGQTAVQIMPPNFNDYHSRRLATRKVPDSKLRRVGENSEASNDADEEGVSAARRTRVDPTSSLLWKAIGQQFEASEALHIDHEDYEITVSDHLGGLESLKISSTKNKIGTSPDHDQEVGRPVKRASLHDSRPLIRVYIARNESTLPAGKNALWMHLRTSTARLNHIKKRPTEDSNGADKAPTKAVARGGPRGRPWRDARKLAPLNVKSTFGHRCRSGPRSIVRAPQIFP
jgi:hypothetical protein